MTEVDLNKYLGRFPKSTRVALENPKARERFLRRVWCDYKEVAVYRAVKNADKFDREDFRSKAQEKGLSDEEIRWRLEPKNKKIPGAAIEFYGVSVNEDELEMKKSLSFPSENCQGIARGIMKRENGPADFVEDRTHHNWFIFEDRLENVVADFSVVPQTKSEGAEA